MEVFKYTLAVADYQIVVMPVGAQLLDAQMQGNQLCLWALVNLANPAVQRTIAIHETGQEFAKGGTYVATFQTGPLVFHVFDHGEKT